jgi:hypothetical protein
MLADIGQALQEAKQQRDMAAMHASSAEDAAAEASRSCDALRARIDVATARADDDVAQIAELTRVNQGLRNVLEAATGSSSSGMGGKQPSGKPGTRGMQLQPGLFRSEWYACYRLVATRGHDPECNLVVRQWTLVILFLIFALQTSKLSL